VQLGGWPPPPQRFLIVCLVETLERGSRLRIFPVLPSNPAGKRHRHERRDIGCRVCAAPNPPRYGLPLNRLRISARSEHLHCCRAHAATIRTRVVGRPAAKLERAAGIEPATLAWKARALPLCNARVSLVGREGFEPPYRDAEQIYSLSPLTTRPPTRSGPTVVTGGATGVLFRAIGNTPAKPGPALPNVTQHTVGTFIRKVCIPIAPSLRRQVQHRRPG
jgi:hypothetical protein